MELKKIDSARKMQASENPVSNLDPAANQTADKVDYDSGTEHFTIPPSDQMIQLASELRLPRLSTDDDFPTIRILAVADIDLSSAATLAEHAIREVNWLGGGNVDLCIACGPFLLEDDMRNQYLQGRSKRRLRPAPTAEETAAVEGLFTAAISQLESIVCRVVFCPHSTDPCTTTELRSDHLRLTSNSRNIHGQWLQLAPGLGCAGLVDGQVKSETLTQLIGLAPPTIDLPGVSFGNDMSQTILVTHVSKSERSSFVDSTVGQNHAILNIIGGDFNPTDEQRGNVRIVSPGSLREHGDFALIDVSLCASEHQVPKQLNDKTASSVVLPPFKGAMASRGRYSWRVSRVQFRNVHRQT